VSDSPELNLARRIVSILPPFSPSSSSRVTNEQCLRESRYYLQELDNFALWALKSKYVIDLHKSQWLLYVPPNLALETFCLTCRIFVFYVILTVNSDYSTDTALTGWCLMETHSDYCCVGMNFCISNSSAPLSAFTKSLQLFLLMRRGNYVPTTSGWQSRGAAIIIPANWCCSWCRKDSTSHAVGQRKIFPTMCCRSVTA
jgi:hypothetical protein